MGLVLNWGGRETEELPVLCFCGPFIYIISKACFCFVGAGLGFGGGAVKLLL